MKSIREEYDINVIEQDEESKTFAAIAVSSKEYLNGLKMFGGNFKKTQSVIDDVLTSLVCMNISNTAISKSLNISTKRVSNAKERRIEFNDIVEKENKKCIKIAENNSNKKKVIQKKCVNKKCDSSEESSSCSDVESELSLDFDDFSEKSVESDGEVVMRVKKKENIFHDNINQRKRKTRNDILDLEVVREFCHETCRLDTFNSIQKILVHNYDGSFDYHQVHIRNQSIKEYYKIFERSSMYAIWQRENTTRRNGIKKIPTLKFRSFSNAFCPCCINQKQRDCANHVQVSLVNALKALEI